MKLFKFILLYLFLISPLFQADTIYELIKIPNLEIYNIKTENKLRYFMLNNLLQLVLIIISIVINHQSKI